MTLPPVPETFRWLSSPLGDVLECVPLAAVAPHCFTTRALALSSADGWQRVADALKADGVATLDQVHGRGVVTITRGSERSANRDKGDALVSDDPLTAIAVRAADCVPMLLGDPTSGVVAAVHAGWRGTAAGAATAAVDVMRHEFGVNPDDLVAAIGPSIGACCYEVGSDVVDAFAAAGHARHLVDRWFAIRGRTRLFLDVAGANRDQLVLAGVPEGQIQTCGLCTAMHLDVLTSYRMEKERATRIAAVIRAPHERRRPSPHWRDDRRLD